MLGEAERRRRFGYALQQVLAKRDLSERQLAQKLGIDARHVAKWRTGRGVPDYYQTIQLAQELQVSEDLFRDPPEVPEPPSYPLEDYLLENQGKDGATKVSA